MATLAATAARTSDELNRLWDEIGLPQDERTAALGELNAEVEKVYVTRVNAEMARRDALKQRICATLADMTNMLVAMGRDADAASTAPGASLRGRLQALEARAHEVRVAFDTRLKELTELHKMLHQLWHDVGAAPYAEFESVGKALTDERVAAYKEAIASAQAVKNERASVINDIVTDITLMWEELGLQPTDTVDVAVATDSTTLGFAPGVIDMLRARAAALSEERSRREVLISSIGENITKLWARLKTQESEQTGWLESHCGLGDDVIQACHDKLHTLEDELRTKLSTLVEEARDAIRGLWSELALGDATRAEFTAMAATGGAITEDCLRTHEAYLETLQARAAIIRPVIKAIEKREVILEERAKLDALQADPTRLLSRRHADLKSRLEEENMERRVKKMLPTVTKKLIATLSDWEKEHSEPFMYNGERYIDTIARQDADFEAQTVARRAEKEAERAAKRSLSDTESTDSVTASISLSKTKFRSTARAVAAFTATSSRSQSMYDSSTSSDPRVAGFIGTVAPAAASRKRTGLGTPRMPDGFNGGGDENVDTNAGDTAVPRKKHRSAPPSATEESSMPQAAAVSTDTGEGHTSRIPTRRR